MTYDIKQLNLSAKDKPGGNIPGILDKVKKQGRLSRGEIMALLAIDDVLNLELLFSAARDSRNAATGRRVFLYGFVYFTTWCRNDCSFCYFRKSNKIHRYRKSPDEILRICDELAESGVHLIDLTMGEDAQYHAESFASLFSIIREIKNRTGLPVMVSPGVVSDDLVYKFADAGADWFALYQETHNRSLFKKLRDNQDYDLRMQVKKHAQKTGMLIEEGILTGVGETLSDIADSILEMGSMGAKQLRVMTFVPQEGIPMKAIQGEDTNLECKIIAIMRLLYPGALIPASLDVEGIEGLSRRMNAGANLITSIIPPMKGLSGVAQNSPLVSEEGRSVAQVSLILAEMDLEPATAEDYRQHLEKLKAESTNKGPMSEAEK